MARLPSSALAFGFGVVLGCGSCAPKLDSRKLEADIQADMSAKGVALSAMACPSVRLAKGMHFECTATDSNATRAVFDVSVVGENNSDVSWKLHGKFENMAIVGDRLEQSLSSQMGQPVDVTCPSKNIIIQKAVTFACDAKVGPAKTMRFVFTAKSEQGDWDAKMQEQ